MNPENQRIKELRDKLGLDQLTFSEALGLKQGSYSDIERGRIGVSRKVKQKLYELYSVNEDWFETGLGEPFSELPNKTEILTKKQQTQMNIEEYQRRINELEKQIEFYKMILESKENELKKTDELLKTVRDMVEILKEEKEVLKQRNSCYKQVEDAGLKVNES